MSENSTDIKRNDGLLAVYTLALKNIFCCNYEPLLFFLDECLSEAKYDNYISLHSISGSVRIRSKEQETRVQDRIKNGVSKREILVDKPRDFENHPLGLLCLSTCTTI